MARELVLIPLTVLLTALLHQQPATSRQPQLTVRLKATLSGHSKAIERIAFSPDGTLVTTSSEDFTVRVWDVETGVLKAILSGEDKAKWERDRWYYNWPYIKAHDFPASF